SKLGLGGDVETGHYRGRPLIQVWMSASRRIGNATPGKTVNRQGEDVPLFSLAVYCKKFVSESVKFSAGLGERKSLIDQYIELRVDAVQRLPKRKRSNGIVGGEHRHGGPEHSGIQSREQAGNLPAIRGDEVTIGFRWTVDQTLQPEAP